MNLLLVAGDEHGAEAEQRTYLDTLVEWTARDGVPASHMSCRGDAATMIDRHAQAIEADLIVMTTDQGSAVHNLISDSVASSVIKKTLTPTLLLRPTDDWRSRYSTFGRIMVALDGSEAAESVLPYVRVFTNRFRSKVLLLSVPEGSESEGYGDTIERYLNEIAATLQAEGVDVATLFTGSGPARTILAVSVEHRVDLILMASHGRGGTARTQIHLGSVTDRVAAEAPCPLFVVPLTRSP